MDRGRETVGKRHETHRYCSVCRVGGRGFREEGRWVGKRDGSMRPVFYFFLFFFAC
jgi:hypothetical protein